MPLATLPEMYEDDEPIMDSFAPRGMPPRIDNPQVAVQQINENLAVMGLRPLAFDGRYLDTASAIDTIHSLFVQLEKSKNYNEELSDALRRQRSDGAVLQRKFKKVSEQLEQSQRDIAQWNVKLATNDQDHKKYRERCQGELNELNQRNKELQFKIQQMAKQQKRSEADAERAKERLAKFIADKELSAGRTGGISVAPYNEAPDLRRALRSGEDLQSELSKVYEAQIEDIRGDVVGLQRMLYAVNEELLSLATHYASETDLLRPNRSVFELPFKTGREAIEDLMRFNLSLLRGALEDYSNRDAELEELANRVDDC
eukprot:TRINITY_DN94099_c0_g1_i1.p1 TRINITY_DN94099_c0_g1~~TRINITY_DN94099_c0_g1_i1.p1  ORF type:complete len:315 (-),score=86.28 TRINITY_DN94099_c0_g1_i1:177-1121(-)